MKGNIRRELAFWSALAMSNIWFAVDEFTVGYFWVILALIMLVLDLFDLFQS